MVVVNPNSLEVLTYRQENDGVGNPNTRWLSIDRSLARSLETLTYRQENDGVGKG